MSVDENPLVTRQTLEDAIRRLKEPTRLYYTSPASRAEMTAQLEDALRRLAPSDNIEATTRLKEEQ